MTFQVNEFINAEIDKASAAGLSGYVDNYMAGEIAREAVLRVIGDKATLINNLSGLCHRASVDGGWWNDLQTGEDLHGKRNEGELLMLITSEISEAFEALRKDLSDDHLTHRKGCEVELADALIRIFDFAGSKGYDLGGALVEKMAYNARREDHRRENRLKADGKKW